jgi:hypothetical protein
MSDALRLDDRHRNTLGIGVFGIEGPIIPVSALETNRRAIQVPIDVDGVCVVPFTGTEMWQS